MTAVELLAVELLQLADRQAATPCQGPHGDRWTSDHADDREWAAHCCRLCPVVAACRLVADETGEKHHVWGGVDRTPPPAKRKSAPAAQAVGGRGG